MKVLVTFASEAEFSPWRKLHHFRSISTGVRLMYETEMGSGLVQVLVTGMGWENAARAISMGMTPSPDFCISTGLAGGLKPAWRAGEILAARSVHEGRGFHQIRGDEVLLKTAAEHGAKIADSFLTSRRIVTSPDEKLQLGQFADAVEMEGYPVLAAAYQRGIPAVAIRAIADPLEVELPLDLSRVIGERGELRVGRLLAQVARRPHRLGDFLHLSAEAGRAARQLVRFLDGYILSAAQEVERYERECPVAAT